MTKLLALVIIGLAFCSTFCSTGCLHPRIGPQSLPRDRSAYSGSLSDSWKQETLLNIVKVRYLDPPVFVEVGSIVASYTLAENAAVGGTIVTQGASNATLGGSINLSTTPTITYTPLTGSAYIKGLVTPLSPEVLFTAIQNGLPADSVLLSSFTSINGLRRLAISVKAIRSFPTQDLNKKAPVSTQSPGPRKGDEKSYGQYPSAGVVSSVIFASCNCFARAYRFLRQPESRTALQSD